MDVVKAVLFDLDGTLLDTWHDILHCLKIVEHKYVGQFFNRSELARDQISLGTEAMLKVALGKEFIEPKIVAETEKIYADLPFDKQKSRPFDGVEKIIDHFNLKEIPWGIVTNKPKVMMRGIFKAFPKLYPLSNCVICPEDVSGKKKPDPTPILTACKVLGVLPSNCIFVGDSMHDMDAGNRAGVITVGALYGYVPKNHDPIKEWKAHFYIKNASEISAILAKCAAIKNQQELTALSNKM